ncbi:phosphotransferase [Microbacterium sp. SLBN-146]|uniref:phosphotransferase n=1 Tax=Microbacterium sp. SLBN-146 TaxID=2768457 RepID=UPI0011538AD1|nr:phosphotransferase [Microbacterium sp. SLBN-146]TQJ30993.1 hypothetical protein FBY39_1452 [Microbacterium sp. SLBN-146]
MYIAPPERALLVDALALDPASEITLVSREPLGSGSVAGFSVASVDGSLTYYVDTSTRRVVQETGLLVGTPEEPSVRIWLHPSDPYLPALAAVAFSQAAETLLDRLGVRATGMPQMVAYRPGRRAVLRVPVGDTFAWIKAVLPSRTSAIVDAHRALADAGVPVPALRGWSDAGLVVWDHAFGTAAQDADWTADGLLDEVDALRDRLARASIERSARTDLVRRLEWYADRLDTVLPDAWRPVAAGIAARARASWGEEPAVTIHGDLHFGQVFLDADLRVSSVIDVDTAGRGEPSDDTAAFLSHAIASALLTPAPRDLRLWELADRAIRRWDAAGSGLRARAATHLLGHAIGAWELGDRERAELLLRAADDVSLGRVEPLRAATET